MANSSVMTVKSSENRAKWHELTKTLQVILDSTVTITSVVTDELGDIVDYTFKITGGVAGEPTGFYYEADDTPVLYDDLLSSTDEFKMPIPVAWGGVLETNGEISEGSGGGTSMPASEGTPAFVCDLIDQPSVEVTDSVEDGFAKSLVALIVQAMIDAVAREKALSEEEAGTHVMSEEVPLAIKGMKRRPLYFAVVNANQLVQAYGTFDASASSDTGTYSPQIYSIGSDALIVVYFKATHAYMSMCTVSGNTITSVGSPYGIGEINGTIHGTFMKKEINGGDFSTDYYFVLAFTQADYNVYFKGFKFNTLALTGVTSSNLVFSTTQSGIAPLTYTSIKVLKNPTDFTNTKLHIALSTGSALKLASFSVDFSVPSVSSIMSTSDSFISGISGNVFEVANLANGLLVYYNTGTQSKAQLVGVSGMDQSYFLSGSAIVFSDQELVSLEVYDDCIVHKGSDGHVYLKKFATVPELDVTSNLGLGEFGDTSFHISGFMETIEGDPFPIFINYVCVFTETDGVWSVSKYNASTMEAGGSPTVVSNTSGPITACYSDAADPVPAVFVKSTTTAHKIVF